MHTSSAVIRSKDTQQPKTFLRRARTDVLPLSYTPSRIQTLEYNSIHQMMAANSRSG
jgi:hypothetical protein